MIGHDTNKNRINNSISNIIKKIMLSTIIKTSFITIPIPIENPTKPFLYSFFIGQKNVRIKSGKENSCKNAIFSEAK